MPPEDRKQSSLSAPSPGRLAPGREAIARALGGLRFGEGVRVGLLGDSGCGKTHLARAVVAEYLAQSPGVALVADTKAEGRFGGQVYQSPADLAGRPPAPEPRILAFRGNPFAGAAVDCDAVAALAWGLAGRRWPTLLVQDELDAATVAGQWRRGVRWLPQTLTQGRAHRVSMLWGCQSPQRVPVEAFDQSDYILCFRLAGLGVRLLRDRGYLDGLPDRLVAGLPGPTAPPAARGAFVLLARGGDWDGRVYRL